MKNILSRFHGSLSRDESGLALIEFALSLPILLSLGLGGVEMAHLALTTERVQQIALLVADNAGRVRDSIDERDVNEIMTGAKLVGDGINFANKGRIILSDVQTNQLATGQWIRWQRCAGAKNVASSYGTQGKGRMDMTLPAIGPAGNQIAPATGTIVMFVEVVYDYQPIVPIDVIGVTARTMRATAAFNVRQRKPVSDKDALGVPLSSPPADLQNAGSLPAGQTADCSTFSA